MEFILPFQIDPSPHKISYDQKIFFLGSCFTEEIGNNFKNLKFDVLQNPNGILYDPVSISSSLSSYIENKQFADDDLFLHDEIWHSWQHHSAFSGLDKDTVLKNINESQSHANSFLKTTSWLVITLGTSFHYLLKDNNEPVANCHKAPANYFDKRLISIDDIYSSLSTAIKKLRLYNPGINIIFTISPVRHVRDGVTENNRSKARLIEAVHSIVENNNSVFYFPAYELVIDVLRDYRFYKSDMVHANEMAVNYVFEIFCNTYLDDPAKKLIIELKSLVNAMNHRPFQKESVAHKNFLKKQLEIARKIIAANPTINLTKEIDYFSCNDR